jgi:formylglycine-generating enzyme required for sulfatase activity/serine/threonine protein kinase
MADDTLQLVGTLVAEKYLVEQLVAEGGFALLYKATHQIWKRPVALKVFKALGDVTKANKDELLADFIREGALLAELSEKSASICQARDVGMLTTAAGESIPYMVLEWLEGSSLEQVLEYERAVRAPPRTLLETMTLLGPIGEALALAHARGVAHRDVKPANIFLLGEPRGASCPVKLLDFGIAKVVMDAQKAGGAFASTTGTMTSFTPSYAAPEQFSRSNGATGPWTDTFALALVVVECITGRGALDGDDFLQIAYAATNPARRPTPRALGATVSDEVEAVFERALAVSPTARYAHVGEFWNALRVAMGQDPITLGPSSHVSQADFLARGSSVASVPSTQVTPRGSPAPVVRPVSPTAISGQFSSDTGPRAAVPPSSNRGVAAALSIGGVLVMLAVAGGLVATVAHFATHGTPTATAAPPPVAAPAPPPVVPPPARPKTTCAADMVYIPGGQFFMGSDDGLPMEKPSHNVKLTPFCIGIHEVTTASYLACSNEGKCKRASKVNEWTGITGVDHKAYDPLCNIDAVGTRGQHPINCVDWERADTYCKAHDGRLPTEAEWEFAARGPDGRQYPWGDEAPSSKYLNACGSECVAWGLAHNAPQRAMYKSDDGWATTAPVGSFPAGKSRYGLEDVVGNVWEWVSDWYAAYGDAAEVDPKGPESGKGKVMRGGSWNGAEPSWVRPTFRFMNDPASSSYGVGFRCAADPK